MDRVCLISMYVYIYTHTHDVSKYFFDRNKIMKTSMRMVVYEKSKKKGKKKTARKDFQLGFQTSL